MTSYTASERESSLDVTIVANDTATVPNGWLQLEVIEPGTEALKYGESSKNHFNIVDTLGPWNS